MTAARLSQLSTLSSTTGAQQRWDIAERGADSWVFIGGACAFSGVLSVIPHQRVDSCDPM